ncbi:MAG: ribulose-bisphosphate carboxylase large chain [Candidatus Methanomethylophilaceae archaeon]|nr:ribulose-bisphosphate carboxylase large chain [Candidatus Methanomethylophilaceae archaeon]MDI3541159.1 ribulose-bisphosphate carboxylase large chain [Candidatus Methanomethylophilaceae archaeon]
MTYSERYLHLEEKIDIDSHVLCRYRIKTERMSIEEAAAAIATEQSTGTWTDLVTLKDEIFEKYGAKVVEIKGNEASIAFPEDDFSIDVGGVPQILSVIAGNLFGLADIDGVRLEDVIFPPGILKQFKGPKFGIGGLRKILDRPEKPLVGTIVKPKIGLSPKETAEYILECGRGGLTNSKDDETLVNQEFCPIEERTVAIAEALDTLKDEGRRMVHAINVSTSGHRILELAERVQELGALEIMVDVLTCGFGAVQALAEDPSIKVPIHVHRTMHGAITRNPEHGISMLPFTKLVRMCGGDALHIGSLGVGKMRGTKKEDLANRDACIDSTVPYKPVMPVCSGGLHPGMVKKIVEIAGKDVQIQAGGGVAGHPGGIRKGAMAMSQAVDASFQGIELSQYAKKHKELMDALNKWGCL